MIPAQLIRTLRRAAELCGVDLVAEVTDAATHDDALELLDQLSEAVDADRPRPAGSPEPGRGPGWRARRILDLARAGRRDTEIAAELGLGVEAVRSTRRRYGVEGQGVYVPEGSGWEERVREMHGRGLTTAEMVAETGWATRTVQQRLWRLQLRAHRARRAADQ